MTLIISMLLSQMFLRRSGYGCNMRIKRLLKTIAFPRAIQLNMTSDLEEYKSLVITGIHHE